MGLSVYINIILYLSIMTLCTLILNPSVLYTPVHVAQKIMAVASPYLPYQQSKHRRRGCCHDRGGYLVLSEAFSSQWLRDFSTVPSARKPDRAKTESCDPTIDAAACLQWVGAPELRVPRDKPKQKALLPTQRSHL